MLRRIFNQLRLRSEQGLWMVICLFIMPPFLLLYTIFYPFIYFEDKKISREFKNKLVQHNGMELFTYTSRKNSKTIIERDILPNLPKELTVVYLDGRKPTSSLEPLLVSQILYRIKNIGFPNIVRISDGDIKDVSIKKEFYEALNKGSSMNELVDLIHDKLKILRG